MRLGGCRVIIKCGKKVYEDGHSVSEDGKEVTCNIESVPDKVSVPWTVVIQQWTHGQYQKIELLD